LRNENQAIFNGSHKCIQTRSSCSFTYMVIHCKSILINKVRICNTWISKNYSKYNKNEFHHTYEYSNKIQIYNTTKITNKTKNM